MSETVRLPPGYRLLEFETIDSTNAEARRQAERGAPDGLLIRTRSQTAGRGRRDRAWDSPPGNLYFSLLLRPRVDVDTAAQLSFVAALALGDALGGLLPPLVALTYKWPNDLLLNGRKVSGILLESTVRAPQRLEWVIVGIGVNIRSFPDGAEFPATSFEFEGASNVSSDDILGAFVRHFRRWSSIWTHEGFGPLRRAWLARAHGLGDPIEVRLDQERVQGTFLDLDESGALVLELTSGDSRRIVAGAVFPPTTAP